MLTRPTTGYGGRSTSSPVHNNSFWHLTRNRISNGSGIIAFHAPRQILAKANPQGNLEDGLARAVGKGNAGWTTSKSRRAPHSCAELLMKASRTKKKKKAGRGFLLNRPSCLNEDSVRDRTKLILSLFLCYFVRFFLSSSSSSMFLLLFFFFIPSWNMLLFSVPRPLFLSSMFVKTNRRLGLTLLWGVCEDGGWRRGGMGDGGRWQT